MEKFPFKIAIVNFQLVKYRMWNVDNVEEVVYTVGTQLPILSIHRNFISDSFSPNRGI